MNTPPIALDSAFPIIAEKPEHILHPGMSLRTCAALVAMHAILSKNPSYDPSEVARTATMNADALIKSLGE